MMDEIAKFALAVQFLTRLPIPARIKFTPERMAGSVAYYPLVGLLVGGLSALIFWAASLALPVLVSLILAVAAGFLLTGGFHEDGLADTFDGIGGGLTRERSLEIMKDSRIGTYGTLALVSMIALKVAALSEMAQASPLLVLGLLPAAHGLSRFSSVMVIATSKYVRDEGTGKPVARGSSALTLTIAGVTAAAILAGLIWAGPPMLAVYGVIGLVAGHVLMRAFFERKLKGYTGDTLGAVQQLSEVGFYLGVLSWL
ncbi:MAG: adenosylcobinamide-GDP ribazoletransferase [Alphaproteobacteria bacterium]|nr:adenosylcobinamide-GDP ribazoletransferase [Hyphomonas sp.]MBR9807705.1 adenosylcobinamide-GDP ribazoletransferase [Alphaproteobacteria bacterium]|tara:strand:- start:1266 stop:2033 length:768 start_codon:yes stop_codon:yes gene_type:complete